MKSIFVYILLLCTACMNTTVQNEKADRLADIQKKNMETANKLFEYFNTHEWAKMAALYKDTALFRDPSLGVNPVPQTRQQTIAKYTQLQEVFSDIHDNVTAVYAAGEKNVVVEFTSTGTAPDGTRFELPVCSVLTVENGEIVQDNTYYDNSGK
ncbi:MAG: nuclear transport factor 2 family protein [Bacteroidia bacterium]|jgi:ketosteroid isomerase-like protein|nr:nuclear transport factor 2 family protein [Bacteroidia bacterium]